MFLYRNSPGCGPHCAFLQRSSVRHPMYTGAIPVCVGAPLALGSWWGLLFTPLFIAWFAWRLLNEEEFLRTNLQRCEEYTRKVRYRLV